MRTHRYLPFFSFEDTEVLQTYEISVIDFQERTPIKGLAIRKNQFLMGLLCIFRKICWVDDGH